MGLPIRRCPKIECSSRKFFIFTRGTFERFFLVLASAGTTEKKRKRKTKKKNEKMKHEKQKHEDFHVFLPHTRNSQRFPWFVVTDAKTSNEHFRFSWLFSECVLFPLNINNQFWGSPFYRGKVAISIGRETKHTFCRRKFTKIKFAKGSSSNSNFLPRTTNHPTTTQSV